MKLQLLVYILFLFGGLPLARAQQTQASSALLDRAGFAGSSDANSFKAICPTIRVDGDGVTWSEMELRLVCGDGSQDAIGQPWSRVPPNQAAYFLRGFLQTRGYHQALFIQDGDILFVRVGSISRLAHFNLGFSIDGGPSTWDPPRRRLVFGTPLTPALLNDLEGWALTQIKNEGYACAEGATRADPLTGVAEVKLAPGSLKYIRSVENTGDTGLRPGALDRYNAFLLNSLYRERLITLTRRRTQEDGFLQNLVLTARCVPPQGSRTASTDSEALTIVRDVVLGPSRTVRIGVGASTDEGARLRAIVRQNRIGDSASSAQAKVNLSYLNELLNRQVADASFRWYYAPGEARSYIEPSVSFEHLGESAFESQSLETRALHGWNREFSDGQLDFRLGPNFLITQISRGKGVPSSSIVYIEATARWLSHDFEYFTSSPRGGETVETSLLLTQERWGANFTAQRLRISGEKLWPVLRYDPPLLILGVRFDLSSVFSPNEAVTSDLPPRFLTFLGGDRDLRGFDRASLPRSGVGALSGGYVGTEARFHKVILRRADVFAFLDAGLLGRANFQLRKPVFLSPGAGLRWESPFGVFRVFLAQRFTADQAPGEPSFDRDYRIGFTYGEEF